MANFTETLMNKFLAAVDEIKDPAVRAGVIANVLVGRTASVGAIETIETAALKEAAPVVKKSRKKDAAPAYDGSAAVAASPVTPEPAVVTPAAAPIPEAKAEEAAPVIVKPEATPEQIANVEKAVKVPEPWLPKKGETAEERQNRQAALIANFGDMTLAEINKDAKVKPYFVVELNAITEFYKLMLKVFGVSYDEAGKEIDAGQFTAADVLQLVHHYIKEADESAENSGQVKVDKLLTKFCPYLISLYTLFNNYTGEQIDEAGMKMLGSKEFRKSRINIKNIDALLAILAE